MKPQFLFFLLHDQNFIADLDELEHAKKKKKLWKCQTFGMTPPQLWKFTTFFFLNDNLPKSFSKLAEKFTSCKMNEGWMKSDEGWMNSD